MAWGFIARVHVRTENCTNYSWLNCVILVKFGRGKWNRSRFLYLMWSGNCDQLETIRATPKGTTTRPREIIKEIKWNSRRSATQRETEKEEKKRTDGTSRKRIVKGSFWLRCVSNLMRRAWATHPNQNAEIVILDLKIQQYSAYQKQTLNIERQIGEN